MSPRPLEEVTGRLSEIEALDGLAEWAQKIVRTAVPQESRLKDVLSGTWLGHPAHPPLTDVVIGAWTGALVLDLFGDERSDGAARRLVGAGILAAVPTALTGLSDWAELRDGARRLGAVHALGNSTALVLNTLSWAVRGNGRRRTGVALSLLAFGAASASAWLGGHLAFGKGVGVDQTVFQESPSEWTEVAEPGDLTEGALVRREVDGVGVLLVRSEGAIHAVADRCNHRGCSLSEGELRDGTIVCPCHGSAFRLDGTLVKGPATASQPAFEVRAAGGRVEIRQPQAS
jgi:nitrite reductase/ring-hydroxylating ferredoxin subunit/uncharacterized membrane protein